MNSTDETQGEDVYGVDTADSSQEDEFAPPRRRRSTYTPPPQYRESVAAAQPIVDVTAQPVAEPAPQTVAEPAPQAAAEPATQVSAEPEQPRPSYAVYSIEDGSLAADPLDSSPLDATPHDVGVDSVESAVPTTVQPEPPVHTPVWTPPVDESATPTTAIPDWSTQAPVYNLDTPAAQPLAAPPAWTPPVEPPVDVPSDLPAEPPVEPSSPYRPWTPDSHVDTDAYWNTAQRSAPQPVAETLSSPPVWSLDNDEPAANRYRPWVPEPEAETTPVWEALFPSTPPVAPPAADIAPEQVTAPTSEPQSVSEPEPAPAAEPARSEQPAAAAAPVYMSPDDEAATLAAHAPPAGQPWIPQRRSLPDDQLLSVLEAADSRPGGTLDAMDALENEMRLREEEVQEYREWEDSMLAVGTPEALAVVAQVRPEFTAIAIPVELTPTSAIPIQYPDETDTDEPRTAEQPAEQPAEPSQAPGAAPWPFSEPGEPEVPLLPEPPLPEPPLQPGTPAQPDAPVQPQPVEPLVPTEPEAPVAPVDPTVPATPVEPEAPVDPGAPVGPEATDVPHDMPQSWFDALATPIVDPSAADAPIDTQSAAPAPTFVAQPTGYPVPKFDDLLAPEPHTTPADEPVAAEPEAKPKRPFGVAVADGEPQNLETQKPETPNPEAPADEAPKRARTPIFALELAGDRPTPRDLRTGRAARMFWLWFAANSSVVSIALGATVFSLGMSLRQSVVAALAGVGLSFIPLGLGTLAGKRSGQPTMIVSRAVFGLIGNVAPAVLAVVSRVFWGAVLLWLFAASVSAVIAGGGQSTAGLVVVFIVVGVMLAGVVAFVGYWLLARVQLIVSVVSAVLIVGFIVLTWQHVDLRAALGVADGPWVLVVTGAVVVFSFLGLVWANSSSDLARYQRPESPGATSMLWANFGATLPSFLLVAYGALLAASDQQLGERIVSDPVGALTGILPGWYPVPLIVATGLSLLSGVVITAYSGAFALQATGLRVERQWASLVMGALVAVVAVGFSLLDVDLAGVFRDLATTLAVPVAAWAGIFAADTMIRNRPFHTASLLRVGGVYPKVNWVNLPALAVITALGWGLTTATVAGLGWQGYVFRLAGVDPAGDLAASDLGVIVALVLGLLVPIVSGIPAIRRQEAAGRPI